MRPKTFWLENYYIGALPKRKLPRDLYHGRRDFIIPFCGSRSATSSSVAENKTRPVDPLLQDSGILRLKYDWDTSIVPRRESSFLSRD